MLRVQIFFYPFSARTTLKKLLALSSFNPIFKLLFM